MSITQLFSKNSAWLIVGIFLGIGAATYEKTFKGSAIALNPSKRSLASAGPGKQIHSKIASHFDVTIEVISLTKESLELKGEILPRTDADEVTIKWIPFKGVSLSSDTNSQTFYDVKAGVPLQVTAKGDRLPGEDEAVVHLAAETRIGGIKYGGVASFSSAETEEQERAPSMYKTQEAGFSSNEKNETPVPKFFQ